MRRCGLPTKALENLTTKDKGPGLLNQTCVVDSCGPLFVAVQCIATMPGER